MGRYTSFPGNFAQVLCELFFVSYFFFGPIGAGVWWTLSPWVLNVCSWRSLWLCSGAYFIQLFLYRPHLSRGWPYEWMLYGPLANFALCYHDATCIREGPPLDPKGRYLFAMYPHGVYGLCRMFSAGSLCWGKLFPGVSKRWGSFGAAFMLPGIRETSLFFGCLDASKPVLERAAKRGESLALLPGGIDEMMLTDGCSKETRLVMQDRKGFVKLAIENGLDIVPGFCFGEKWVHDAVQLPAFARRLLRPLRLSGTFPLGRGPTLLGKLSPSMNYVWGQPISVRQQTPVEEAYLDKIHAEVIKSVQGIFDRYRERFGYDADEKLVVVSVAEAKAFIAGQSSNGAKKND